MNSYLEQLQRLNHILLDEMPEYKEQGQRFAQTEEEQQRLFRSLLNVRPPMDASPEFLALQDDYLQGQEKGVVYLEDLTPVKPNLYLWQGDITRLAVDGIVNAANDALLGCFIPCHGCIDNVIHSCAGVQLRLACNEIMEKQGCRENTGQAKITKAYNLPSNHVIHTVGSIVGGALTAQDCQLLESCYRSCMELAMAEGLQSIAFCCISTGEFRFPNGPASEIAVGTVQQILKETKSEIKVIFNVFKDVDYGLYSRLLG